MQTNYVKLVVEGRPQTTKK